MVVKSLLIAMVFTGPVALKLKAQSNLEITASIRFPFVAGTRSIAPGTYQFSLIGSPFLLSVLNVKTGHQELFTVHPGSQQGFEPNGCLTFQTINSSSVLTDVHFPGSEALILVNGPHDAMGSQSRLCSKSEPLSEELNKKWESRLDHAADRFGRKSEN
jgi:hypothetical protein